MSEKVARYENQACELNGAFYLVVLVGNLSALRVWTRPASNERVFGFVGGIDFEAASFSFGALAEELRCAFRIKKP